MSSHPPSLVHPHVKCTIHGTDMIRRRNPGGGFFHSCCLHESQGCRVTWSDRDQRYFRDPTVVARATKFRGRGFSLRERIIVTLVGQGAGTRDEVERVLDVEGLGTFASLVA